MKDFSVVILAAGKGTRMHSNLPKSLHLINGKSIIQYVVKTAQQLKPKEICVVVGYGKEKIAEALSGYPVRYVQQESPLGTGHALLQAEKAISSSSENILVLYGDMPLIKKKTLNALISAQDTKNADATILTAVFENPPAYGRIVRGYQGKIKRIVEEKDASPEIRLIKEVNTGFYIFNSPLIFEILKKIKPDNIQNEYYLTDAIALLIESGKKVETVLMKNPEEAFGINTQEQLTEAERLLKKQ